MARDQGEETPEMSISPARPDEVSPAAVGLVDWSPLSAITGTRPLISKYGVPRYSMKEWRKANQALFGSVPSVDSLEHESKKVISGIAADIDKQQLESTQKIKQRAADIYASHDTARQYSQDIKEELELLAQCKLRIRKALENLNIVDGINRECREIRKNRLTEDLVRDVVEEELFQESGLCQEIRELYRSAMAEFDTQFSSLKKVSIEIQAVWSDQREALELETENVAMTNKSPDISYCHGIARLEQEMSSTELWEKYTKEILQSVKTTLDNSRNFRRKISSPVIEDSAKDLASQGNKVVKAFLQRIEETQSALHEMECELDRTLKEIAHCEQLYLELETLGRQIDYNLKVVQTRLDNRRKRPGVENCRDKAQFGLSLIVNDEAGQITHPENDRNWKGSYGDTQTQNRCRLRRQEMQLLQTKRKKGLSETGITPKKSQKLASKTPSSVHTKLPIKLTVINVEWIKQTNRKSAIKIERLMNELKTVCQRVTAIQQQLQKLNDTITNLYSLRKSLERHIHVKRHTLSIDQQRCMTFRKQFPNPSFLLGF